MSGEMSPAPRREPGRAERVCPIKARPTVDEQTSATLWRPALLLFHHRIAGMILCKNCFRDWHRAERLCYRAETSLIALFLPFYALFGSTCYLSLFSGLPPHIQVDNSSGRQAISIAVVHASCHLLTKDDGGIAVPRRVRYDRGTEPFSIRRICSRLWQQGSRKRHCHDLIYHR